MQSTGTYKKAVMISWCVMMRTELLLETIVGYYDVTIPQKMIGQK